MLHCDSLLKPQSYCDDFNVEFPRQLVDVLVVVNRENLPTIRSSDKYLRSFYGEATNIERRGDGEVDNTLDYKSRDRKIDSPLLRSFG